MWQEIKRSMPWSDEGTWQMNKWYPLPSSVDESDSVCSGLLNGWSIWLLDQKYPEGGFVVDLPVPAMSFELALAICEAHNGEPLS